MILESGMSKGKKRSFAVLAACFLAYCSLYVSRSTITVFASTLSDSGILTVVQYGLVTGLFFIIYAFGRLMNGYLSDVIEARLLIILGVFLAGLSNVLIGLFPSMVLILFMWCLNAIGQSMVWSAILVVVSDNMEQGKKDVSLSIIASSVAFGTVLGLFICSKSYSLGGLTGGFAIPGCLGILISLFALFSLPKGEASAEERKERVSINLRRAFKHKTLTMLFPIIVNGMLKDGITIWLVSYVIACFGVDISKVAGYVFLVPMLGFVGRVAFPWVFRPLGESEAKTALVDYSIAALATIPLCIGTRSMIFAIVCFGIMYALVSMANISFVVMYPVTHSEKGRTGFVSGSIDLMIYSGSGISSVLFGFVVSSYGYRVMFIIWFVLLAVSSVLLLFTRSEKT